MKSKQSGFSLNKIIIIICGQRLKNGRHYSIFSSPHGDHAQSRLLCHEQRCSDGPPITAATRADGTLWRASGPRGLAQLEHCLSNGSKAATDPSQKETRTTAETSGDSGQASILKFYAPLSPYGAESRNW
jgi:hypothetical protein